MVIDNDREGGVHEVNAHVSRAESLREPVRAERLGLTLIRTSEHSRMEEAG